MTSSDTLGLSADQLLSTTRSVRKHLDFDRPVPREVIMECLQLALQAPTGSNAQGWHWVVVEDQGDKTTIAELYRRNYAAYSGARDMSKIPEGSQTARVVSSSQYLADNFDRVPLMVIPCIWGDLDGADAATAAGAWGSILPAMWSFMLALRERGLGTSWTTLHLPGDGAQRTAELLGIPHPEVTQAGLLPIAYTKGTDFKPAKRGPAEEVTHWGRW